MIDGRDRVSRRLVPGAAFLALIAGPVAAFADEATGDSPLGVPTEREIRAQITAPRSAVLSSETAGVVVSVSVRDGERFKKGDVLVRFDCSTHEAQLARVKAEYEKRARVQEVNDRLKRLGSISAKEIAVGSADVDAARAEVTTAEILVRRCVIHAPFQGRVAGVTAKEHQFTPEGQPLLDILDDSELELETIVPSRWLGWLRVGSKFEIQVDETGRRYPTEVARISGRVDAVSQSIKIYARVVGDTVDLLPGMSGRALIAPPDGRP